MKIKRILPLIAAGAFSLSSAQVQAQVEYKWLALGSLHNFFANFGTEIEIGRGNNLQQDGLAWPGIFENQDAQAAKGMWLGATDWTDENGTHFATKVIHSGPRVREVSSFFPVEFKLISKQEPTVVTVDGVESFRVEQTVDEVDPTIPGDRMIYSKFNTALGITVERKVHQFAQQFHDNYHIYELTFTNTGYVSKENVKRIDAPVKGFMLYEQARWAPVRMTRYVIGNSSGWGMNTMVDRRGDGLNSSGSPEENEFKAHYAWHGRLPGFSGGFDNVGAPIIIPVTSNGYVSAADSIGRLGAYHFVGRVNIHADKSGTDHTNDTNQPSTMMEVDSDLGLLSNNDAFNTAKMDAEYTLMTTGRNQVRHAYAIEPSGDAGFISPTGDPAKGSSGGWSAAVGYGPYTLQPGESITIVYAEAVSGIGDAYAREVGAEFKATRNAVVKNTKMFQGRDSLFQTFRRAIANYNSNFQLREAPPAPITFNVNSAGNGINLDWEFASDANMSEVDHIDIYRSAYSTDTTAVKIGSVSASETEFQDNDNTPLPAGPPIRGVDYYYYITAVGTAAGTDAALTPNKPLSSSRYYTQSYDFARLLRPPGNFMSEITIVPNPYVNTSADNLRFGRDTRIAFYEVPAKCSIKIFTEIGEFVQEISGNGSGDVYWDLMTKSRQRISSGLYIAIIKNLDTGEQITKKFVVIF